MPTRDPEKLKEQRKRYYEKNKEKLYAQQREWYHANKHRPEIKEMYEKANKNWRENNRDQYLESKRVSSRRRYNDNIEEERKRNREKRKLQVAHLDAIADELRSLGCTLCGMKDRECLHFHHLEPELKEITIGQMIRIHKPTEEELRFEISKCVVLCANCHSKIHAGTASLPQ